MEPSTVLIALAALVTFGALLGVLYRLTRGRSSRVSASASVTGIELGAGATLLQFSSEVCSACAATHRVLRSVSDEHPTVVHVDVDVTTRPDLVSRFNILQTPTTLVLDSGGVAVARIGGGVRRETVVTELAHALNSSPTSQS